MDKDFCEITCIHENSVKHVQHVMDEAPISSIANIFKALADETRLKIAYALTIEDELCVCDVATIIHSSTATASHHLRHLRKLGLAKYRKEGKLAYYSLDNEYIRQMIQIGLSQNMEVMGH
jgi:ArsR family transcriptional regulator, lead/cadmium/zinc/bismuth-responsive transcriptional repressor